MIIVGDCLVSEDLFEQRFSCNLSACQGACCVEGDAGAPLEQGERDQIAQALDLIKPFMDEVGRISLEEQGIDEEDPFGEPVTTCKPNKECTFAIRENGILSCAIEKANRVHQFGFAKPISCHLYPIRVRKFQEYYALNYHRWDICSAACEKGQLENIPIYRFTKEALIRKFGEEWYALLERSVQETLDSHA